jgi:hypothetical protein
VSTSNDVHKAIDAFHRTGTDWSDFKTWCVGADLHMLPTAPEAIVLYVTALDEGDRKSSTPQLPISDITQSHLLAGSDRL